MDAQRPPMRHARVPALPRLTNSTNVGEVERWGSVLSGGLLVAYGLSRRSWSGLLLAATGGVLAYRGVTGHCPVYGALGLSTADETDRMVRVETGLTVNRPPREVYEHWRRLEQLPRFMHHLASVEERSDGRSHWVARIPKGLGTLEWDAEIVEEREGERLAWRALPGGDVDNSGTVEFTETSDGETALHVVIEYRPPAGVAGKAVAHLLDPVFEQMVKEDVRRFKHLLEAGEIPTVEGQPRGA